MSSEKIPPHYPDAELAQQAGWAAVRTGKALAGTVENATWSFPILSGAVDVAGARREVKIDFRSQALPRNLCECPTGKRGQFCEHALAIYFRWREENKNREVPKITPAVNRSLKFTAQRPAKRAVPAAQFESVPAGTEMRVDGSSQFLAISLPSRDHPNYASAFDLLKQNKFLLDPNSRSWRLLDRHRVLNFLAENREKLVAHYGADFSDEFLARTTNLETAKLVAGAEEKADGSCDVSVRIDAGSAAPADAEALRAALARGQFYFERSDGKIVLLPPALVEEAAALAKKISGSDTAGAAPQLRQRVQTSDFADLENVFEEAGIEFTPPDIWRKRSAALRNLGALEQAPCSPELQNRLRLYQQIGAAWIWHLFQNGLGGILADEMGLGKTVQAIAFLEANAGKDAPALIVCPAALVENWCREIARFAPAMRIHRHHGQRRNLQLAGIDIVVTSYGTLTSDIEIFHETRWNVVIADEAQHIKNRRSQNAKSLRQLRTGGRFVLTGTPVENSLDDMRSLFEFLMPGHLSRLPANMARDERIWHDRRAREQAAPYILRRTKQSVAPELPEKIEQIVYCELEGPQAALYAEKRDSTRTEIFNLEMSGAGEGRLRMAAFNQLLRLRQICAEPRLLDPNLTAGDSAKFRALREIIDEAIDGDHRILLFSQFVEVLKMLRTELDAAGISSCYIDGATRNRQAECDRFNADAGIPIFLISLKAGGVGLNLTGADTVVHFDPWWNPAAEAQATDRAHRIGQTKTVTTIKLIAAGTVEERVLDLQRTKANLLRDLFSESDEANAKISLEDLKELLGE